MKKFVTLTFLLFSFISLFSCGHESDLLEEYLIEIERPDSSSISPKDTTNIPPKDSTYIPKDTTTNNGQGTTNKDTIYCSYEKYMNISTSYGIGQGGACYDKFFFQGYSNNAAIGIFDLEKKVCLGKIDISEPTPSSTIHVNTMNFGSQKYNKNDFFPLLYISSGYTKNVDNKTLSFIYVYRIIRDSKTEAFTATLIQTISLNGFGTWTEGILDNDHDILWIKYEPNSSGGEYRYASFNVPKYESGDIILNKEDYLTDFTLGIQPFTSSNQGYIYYKDKLLLVSGTSATTQKLAFIVINLKTQTRELVIDLSEIGLRSEPENLFFYKDQLMIGYRNAIYKFNVRYLNN